MEGVIHFPAGHLRQAPWITYDSLPQIQQDQVQTVATLKEEQETNRGMVVRGQRGPCNGGLFWARPLAGPNLVNLNLAKAVIKHLRVTNESGAEQPVLYNQITISTVIRDRVCLAYIMQQSFDCNIPGFRIHTSYLCSLHSSTISGVRYTEQEGRRCTTLHMLRRRSPGDDGTPLHGVLHHTDMCSTGHTDHCRWPRARVRRVHLAVCQSYCYKSQA
jgi:hypothetical protein